MEPSFLTFFFIQAKLIQLQCYQYTTGAPTLPGTVIQLYTSTLVHVHCALYTQILVPAWTQ